MLAARPLWRSLPAKPPAFLRLTVRMVEGHGVHRVAAQHRATLRGKAFVATSPNGRFTEGAAAVNGKTLEQVEVRLIAL